MSDKSVPPPVPRPSGSRPSGTRPSEGLGLEAETFFERAGALEQGLVPPPEEGTWMLRGTRKLARHAKRSLPALIVAGVGFLLLLVLLVVRGCS
jgi:hypothetical protein